MIKYIRLGFLILGSLVATSNLCVIMTIRIYSNGPKKVCLIGEVHNTFYRSGSCCRHTEDRDKAHMLDLAQACSNCKKPLTFCIEETADQIDALTKYLSRYPYLVAGTMLALDYFIQNHNGTLDNATFLLADKRGPALYAWGTYMYGWRGVLEKNMFDYWNAIYQLPQELTLRFKAIRLTSQFVDAQLGENPLLRENLFSTSSLFTDYFSKITEQIDFGRIYTVGDLFQELNNFLNELSAKISVLDKNSALYHYLNEYKESLRRAIADAREFFMQSTGNDPKTFEKRIGQCIYDVIVNKSFSYLANESKKWGSQLMRIADMSFALTIDEALLHSDVVILYAGINHVDRLEPFMKLKQFAKTYENEKEIEMEAKDGYTVSLCPDEEMKKYFMEIKHELDL